MMRILANENVPGDVVEALRARGHDVAWVRTSCPGASDVDLISWATSESRLLITFDKDFGELAFHAGLTAPCGIVLFRIRPTSAETLTRAIVAALESRDDWTGHFAVVRADRLRLTPLPEASREG